MSRPRVFISSTYYDFKTIRDDLDRFVTSMGYEPVRHELGHISYGRQEKPENYAYREIEYCDILISVIGGRFGSAATASEYSITQEELRKAHEMGKQVYIFIDRAVHSEFDFYKSNKDVPGIKYTHASDSRIHSFLEEIYSLPRGNPIFPFGTGAEIITILREQWAGLFQRLLVQESLRAQASVTQELQRSLQTVDQLVKFLTEEKIKGDKAIQEILFRDHPVFKAIEDTLPNRYRVYFANLEELDSWMDAGKGFARIDEMIEDDADFFEWQRIFKIKGEDEVRSLYILKSLFDEDGNLKAMSPAKWDASWVRSEIKKNANDDDIPF
ncbi:DUF4062 domain-containing protein [Paraburkholderia hospita]|uniref:DUF4062 domain-containing protein n=1 Tax=Paraburkholderia hospita TaxID=169430 RepID=UPI000B34796A|nr:DUF4062 domain-containing protein [Paraburkholderia hospita]OUL71611.1 hypothetical protein CA603_46765 [Paraburkholderia hospita]